MLQDGEAAVWPPQVHSGVVRIKRTKVEKYHQKGQRSTDLLGTLI